TVPRVPALASVWQLPHVPLPTNSFFPLARSAVDRPHAASASPAATAARVITTRVVSCFRAKAGRRLSARAARGPASSGRRRELVEAALGGGDHALRDPLPAVAPASLGGQCSPRPRAFGRVEPQPGHEFRGDLFDG